MKYLIRLTTLLLSALLLTVPVLSEETASEYTYTGEIDYAKAAASRSGSDSPADPALLPVSEDFSPAAKEMTVMVYMTGSNLESMLGNATKDLAEMNDAGLDFDRTNLLVFTGGSRRWLSRIPSKCNTVLDLSRPAQDQIVAQTASSVSMGDPASLSAFLNFVHENYPSKHYALILWDHGGGPLYGYGSDELFNSDSLLLEEMHTAMEASPFTGENKLDFVGFDACLMGSLESMTIWKSYADYYVGSEELEPGDGWDYHFLSVLNETTDSETIISRIVDTYGAYYEGIRTESYAPDVTLSAVRLSDLQKTLDAMKPLLKKMTEDLSADETYARLQQKRAQTKGFGNLEGSKGEEDFSYDLIDLQDFCTAIGDLYPVEAQGLQTAFSDMLIKSYSNVEGANGATFYYPFRNRGQLSEMSDVFASISGTEDYSLFLKEIREQLLKTRPKDWNLGELTDSGDAYTLTLTDEQLSEMTGAYYSVLRTYEGFYAPVLMHEQIFPDENGILTIPKDPKVICLNADTQNVIPLWTTQIEDQSDTSVYRTEKTILGFEDASDSLGGGSYREERLPSTFVIERSKADDLLTVKTVSANSSDLLSGKNEVVRGHYEEMSSTFSFCDMTYDPSGNLAPLNQWDKSGILFFIQAPLEKSFSLQMRPFSELGESGAVVLEICDANGDSYISMPAPTLMTAETTEILTENGLLTFTLYEDHAALFSYAGMDTELVVPDTVQGRPVTSIEGNCISLFDAFDLQSLTLPEGVSEIGSSAFSGTGLTEISLPSTLTSIGDWAFEGCAALSDVELPAGLTSLGREAFSCCTSLTALDLPTSLETIASGVFSGCTSLTELTVHGEPSFRGDAFCLEEGALYNADQTVMIACPGGLTDSYTIPEGVKEIGYKAFYASELSEVLLPDSLEKIGSFAFYNCENLNVPILPDSITEIGARAFGRVYVDDPLENALLPVRPIHIGSRVSYIGPGAFDGFAIRSFEVVPDNAHYAEKDGFLMNAAKDAVISFCIQADHRIDLPEGTAALDLDLYHYLDFAFSAPLDVYVPDSAEILYETDTFFPSESVLFHVKSGSRIESRIQDYNHYLSDSYYQLLFETYEDPETDLKED